MQILELIMAFGIVIVALFVVILLYAAMFAFLTMIFILSFSLLGNIGCIILWSCVVLCLLGYGIYKDHKKIIAWIKGLRK